ncbi:sodium-dependent dopamine transporter [Plakobranchus ocellatus]|uniref:Sodium-dependent dopamine transporter n=1 Tax=Plakobranchus ocellatus TaxID=259542 RepID=A0AAV4DJ98_9GAST|nr:sodium-dependent dopamine transporter [Plakobranchus ocellatus]
MYMYSDGPNQYSGGGGSSGGGNTDVMSQMNESQALAILQHLDKSDLEHLLNDDSKLKDLVDDLAQVRSLQSRHDDLVATNKSLAEYNLSLRPRLDDLKQTVATHYQRLNDLKTSLAEGKAKLDSLVGQRRLDTVLALLQTEAAETEEASEKLADKFCEDGNIDEFVGDFLTQRALAHQRRIKTERFAELIQQSSASATSAGLATSHAPSHNLYQNHSSSGPAPYPTSGGFGMPQPALFHR